MPSTTNFGWTTPADTDLVKDGAAAIRTLGNGIDTSLVDLKGGTTDQVLAKNSNTDLDFKWVTDATGIQATIFDAKGDLIAASAADTAARLASSGVNGDVLTVDTSTSTGLKWAAPAAGGGKVLQVVQATTSTAMTSTSTSFADSNLSGSITPSSASSKVLVIVSQMLRAFRDSTFQVVSWQLLRGSTAILTYDYQSIAGILSVSSGQTTTGLAIQGIPGIAYLDSPNTTSSTTYKTQIAAGSTANSGSASAQFNGSTSLITLMEIGA